MVDGWNAGLRGGLLPGIWGGEGIVLAFDPGGSPLEWKRPLPKGAGFITLSTVESAVKKSRVGVPEQILLYAVMVAALVGRCVLGGVGGSGLVLVKVTKTEVRNEWMGIDDDCWRVTSFVSR